MFLVTLTYLKPFEVILEHRPVHREHLDKYVRNGMLICCGATVPPEGGLIVMRAKSRAEVEAFAEQDPFYLKGMTSYTITEFNITKHAPEFGVFVD